jgi:hypothetical protein
MSHAMKPDSFNPQTSATALLCPTNDSPAQRLHFEFDAPMRTADIIHYNDGARPVVLASTA